MKLNLRIIGIINMLFLCYLIVIISSQQFVFAEQIDWGDDLRLTSDPANSYYPDIISDNNDNLHVVWKDERQTEGTGGIYYKNYINSSWSDDLLLNPDEAWGLKPEAAVDNNNYIHVVWFAAGTVPDSLDIFHRRFTGSSWDDIVQITTGASYLNTGDSVSGPKILVDSNNHIHIFWSADRNPINSAFTNYKQVAYIYYDNIDWSDIVDLTNDTYDHLFDSATIDLNDDIHLVYTDRWPDGLGGYYFSIQYQNYDGNDWSSPLKIDNSDIATGADIMADTQNYIHITWADARSGNYEIYYSKLESEGNIIIDNKRETWNPEVPGWHGVWRKSSALDSQDNVHVTWHNQEGENNEDFTVRYMILDNDGYIITNKTNLTIATFHIYSDHSPNIVLDSIDRIHMVFMDDRDGNQEIYYKTTLYYDLSILPLSIEFSNDLPENNELIFINTSINNNGGYLTNATVYFYQDNIDPANIIDSDFVQIPPGGTELTSIQWTAITGTHTIWVEIESEDGTLETNLTNNIANKTIIVNDPPMITVTAPPSGIVTVDTFYTISWVANDPDDDAIIELYYDDNNTGFDGTSIDISNQYPSGIVDDNGVSQTYNWDTSTLADGSSWYIYAKIYDGIHAPVYSYSQGEIEIDHPNILPNVEITTPTGGTVLGSVIIQGTANDPDKNNIESVFVSIDNEIDWELATGTISWSYDWDTTSYSNGDHTIYAKAYDGEDISEIVSVMVTVDNGGNIAPQISITYPNNGVTVSGEVEITGTASDDDGFVQVVEIQIDNEVWIELTGTTNWNYDWDTTFYTNGEHKIQARAKDDLGIYSQEKSITVIVDNGGNILPNVEITSHSGGEVVDGMIQIKGTANDYDGNVELVEIRIDNSNWNLAIGTSSWSYSWDTTAYSNGEHVIYARAKDDFNEYSQVKSVTLIVDNGGNLPPIVNIVSPSGITVSETVIISGTATDYDGDSTISFVQLRIDDGDWENTDGITEWSYSWDTTILDDGNYTISARAYDGTDYSMVKSVNVFVDNPHEPELTITSNIPKEVSGTITIQGTASDVDGEITKVEIQIDDGEWEEVGGTADWSYELDTTKLSNGEHTIKIRVHDDEENYYVETLTLEVKNEEDDLPLAWLALLGILVIVALLIIGLSLRKGKSPQKIAPVPVSVTAQPQVQMQELRCPGCGNVFQAEVSSGFVQCPNCGVSGNIES